MALVVFNDGVKRNLGALLAHSGLILNLYQNDYFPLADSVLGNFIECNFSGYNFQIIAPADWGPVIFEGGAAQSIAIPFTFALFGGVVGNLIYGYWVEDAITGEMVCGERISNAPYSMIPGAPPFVLRPHYAVMTMFPGP